MERQTSSPVFTTVHCSCSFGSRLSLFRYELGEYYDIIFNNSDDISRLDNFIKDIEPEEFRMPVLLKKYVKLNGKIICFNVDPKFNDALDGLLILDLFNVPIDTITSLSKEINDKSLLDRFNLSDYTFEKE